MPREDEAGWVRQSCLRWRWRSWVALSVAAEMAYRVSRCQLAAVEFSGKHAVQRGLIGDWAGSPRRRPYALSREGHRGVFGSFRRRA
jgi:hypothetical protein